MARKKIREYDAKRILAARFASLFNTQLPINVAQVDASTDYAALLLLNPWLAANKLVVKPDMLFGQRGKHNLVGLSLSFAEAKDFIQQRLNKVVTISGCTGPCTHFIVEPFMPHSQEFYLCITSNRLDYEIAFSDAGGEEFASRFF